MEIKGEKLELAYGDYTAVRDMDIHVQKGMITSIIGPNGSGKSTVLKGLTRLLGYKNGAVYVDRRNLKEFTSKELAQHIGVLPQIHSAPPDFQVKELVGYGRMPYQKWYQHNSDEDKQIIDWAMKATGVWKQRDKSINQCSGGEKQRVWIAMALAQDTKVLFLDEPTTYLDVRYQLQILKLIQKLNREYGITIVMVLHDINQSLYYSDEIVAMKDGRIIAHGLPEEIITKELVQEVYGVDLTIQSVDGKPFVIPV